MANDTHSAIITALRDLLAGMSEAAGYWYTPTVVAPSDGAMSTDLQNQASDHTILISSGDEFVAEEVGEIIEHVWEIFIVSSRKYQIQSDPIKNFKGGVPPKLTIQNRMLSDIEKAIMGDPQLGGLVDNAIWPRAEVNRNWMIPEGRANIVIRIEVQFSLTKDDL